MNDEEQRDWIHKEVACALNSHCNIIPVFDNFIMQEGIQQFTNDNASFNLTSYNGVKWIHDGTKMLALIKSTDSIRGDAAMTMMDRFLNATMTGTGSQSGNSGIHATTLE